MTHDGHRSIPSPSTAPVGRLDDSVQALVESGAPTLILSPQPKLGRVRVADSRDLGYLASAHRRLVPVRQAEGAPRQRPWTLGPVLDQGKTSQCVVHAIAHWLFAAPQMLRLARLRERVDLTRAYAQAQRRDPWPGEEPLYYGTDVRSGLSVFGEYGYVGGYVWVTDAATTKNFVRTRTPLLTGSDWFTGMYRPSKRGAYVEPSGTLEGGHQYLLRWYYPKEHRRYPDSYEFVNSWGPSWGERGRFRMTADVFNWMFFGGHGDIVCPTETRPPATPVATRS